jgi:hypothetical protein
MYSRVILLLLLFGRGEFMNVSLCEKDLTGEIEAIVLERLLQAHGYDIPSDMCQRFIIKAFRIGERWIL